jgi:hypothetical protein
MGIGPVGLKLGDLICLISGFPAPLLMREERRGHYTIVGPAHIYGIMNGELWTDEDLQDFFVV